MTTAKFMEDCMEYLALNITRMTNVFICGDFNIHYEDADNPDVIIHIDMCETLRLIQHTESPTHKEGHILDHMFTESAGTVKVTRSELGFFISHHSSVKITLEFEKKTIFREKQLLA